MENLHHSLFVEADFSGSQFRVADFSNVKISDARMIKVDISGPIADITINGADVIETPAGRSIP
jgi:uncharacterized protein YjbI with pentapeptide repeats